MAILGLLPILSLKGQVDEEIISSLESRKSCTECEH